MKKLFFYLSFALFLTGCKKTETKPSLSADAETTKKVTQLYSAYGNSNNSLYEKPLPKNLFTPALEKALQEAVDASKEDIEKIKNSAHPTEKPMLLEGSIFTSLYEGYTSYKIKSIDVMESTKPIGAAADVVIQFENSKVSPKAIWIDKVHLIEAFDTGFKIDNIVFGHNTNAKDLKTSLSNFTNNTKK